MLLPSEEVTKTWIRKKGILIKNRPIPSRFSFVVCLAIVFSITFGFLGGYVTAGFTLSENYSSVYESLLAELESSRRCLDRERGLPNALTQNLAAVSQARHAGLQTNDNHHLTNQIQEQAIFSVFGHAIDLISKNDKSAGCAELNNIINLPEYNGKWKSKARYIFKRSCNH